MQQKTNIYVIIVTYNAMQWIDKCIGSLQHSTVPLQVIAIDNGSTDETIAHIRTHYPDVTLLAQSKNLGFGQGNNVGIRYALAQGATHVLLLNQDAWIEPDMVEQLLPYDDGNSLLSPIHLTGEGDRLDKNFKEHALMRANHFAQLVDDWAVGNTHKYATYEINAACWLLPAKIIREIGGFNPMFFHYAEDINYLHRLHYHHKGVYFVPQAKAYHDRANIAQKPLNEQYMYQQMVLRMININDSWCVANARKWRFALSILCAAIRQRQFGYLPMLSHALQRIGHKTKEAKTNRYTQQQIASHWI